MTEKQIDTALRLLSLLVALLTLLTLWESHKLNRRMLDEDRRSS